MKLTIGENIRTQRKAMGLTQEQLAEAMGGRSFSLEELREGQLSGVIRTVMQELPGQGRG